MTVAGTRSDGGGKELLGGFGAEKVDVDCVADLFAEIPLVVFQFGTVEDPLALAADIEKGRLAGDPDDGGFNLLTWSQVSDFFGLFSLEQVFEIVAGRVCHVCFQETVGYGYCPA